jgi:hypothetical protein
MMKEFYVTALVHKPSGRYASNIEAETIDEACEKAKQSLAPGESFGLLMVNNRFVSENPCCRCGHHYIDDRSNEGRSANICPQCWSKMMQVPV